MKAGRGGDDVFMPGSPLALRRMAIGAGGLPDISRTMLPHGSAGSGAKPATVVQTLQALHLLVLFFQLLHDFGFQFFT